MAVAISGLNLTARIQIPILVLCRNKKNPEIITIENNAANIR